MPLNNDQMAIDTVHTAPVNDVDTVTKKQKTSHPVVDKTTIENILNSSHRFHTAVQSWCAGHEFGVSSAQFPGYLFKDDFEIISELFSSEPDTQSSGGGKGNLKKSKTSDDKGTSQPPPQTYSGLGVHHALKWLLQAAQNKYFQSKSDEYHLEKDPINSRVLQAIRNELYNENFYKAELVEWSKAKGFSEQTCREMGTSIYEKAMAESTKTSAKAKHKDAIKLANEPYKAFVTSPEMVEQFCEAFPHIYNKCVPPPGLAQVDGEEVSVTVEKCLAALREMKQADEDANANSANTSISSSTASVTSLPPSSPLPSPPSSPSLVAPPIAPVAPVDTTTVKSDVSNGEAAPMVPADLKMDETSSSSDDSDEDDEDDEEDEATQLILQDMEDNLEEE